ncbi:Kinase interacting family protein, putative isoform 1 [Hibiscus syriacus]|uniref:Kinase interacting family protein, putative isoform 1 n=1 Tax=Hibiscus syriacus TaxID=106335 RepID=A0A6A3CVR2_HIBSY|nr:protein ENHANCED DISEASE RESISTANCE 4-like [Hibiscus syriacus]KAE8733410.1 Kinase interacting family protein, putative isoform 1 [Hibiscus syriacus]
MGGGTTPRVRLVRCPKCRLLLPEVEDVPVYQCGGCDSILVAKNRKAMVESMSLLQETGAAGSDKLVHVSENGESRSSTPQKVHLSQDSASQSGDLDENSSIEGQCNDRKTSGDIDNKCEKLDENGSNEGREDGSGQLQLESSEDCNVQQQGVSIECFSPAELHHENEELMVEEANDKTLQLESVYTGSKSNNKIDSNIRDSSFDDPDAARESNLTVTASAAAGEVISSDNLFSSPNGLMEQPQRSNHRVFDHVSPTESFKTSDFVSPGSELSDPDLGYSSKSTTTRTSHANDGSISSYDGMDDQFLDQKIHSFKNNYRAANYLVPEPEERKRKEKLPAKGLMNGNARNFSSELSNKKLYGTAKYSKWHRDEALEPVLHQRPPRSWMKLVRDEYPSRHPFFQRASLRGYENAGPSRGLHDEFPEYSEQENMKLLRMVRELQDQISKTCNLNGRKTTGRASIDVPWRQKHCPTYYYPQEEKIYPRHEIDNSCTCFHPQRWPCSEQLPPPMFRQSQGYCRAHSGHRCHNCYSYCPSSPHRYLKSHFSNWSHEIISGAQRYRDHELKGYSRDKHYSVRRHGQPTAGGAPFVTCHHCFRPLELPGDFLLSKRRFHQLRCGGCSKVLTFSLQNGNHIVPYEPVGNRTSTMRS